MATRLFLSWIKDFNGIIIAGVGWGVIWYGTVEGKKILVLLLNTLHIPDTLYSKLILLNQRATSFRHLSIVTIPITIIGAIVLINCGYPLDGFAKVYLAIGSISLYFAGAIGFGFIIYTLAIFRYLEENYQEITIDRWALIIQFETLNSFFIVSASYALMGLYFAFRGTLTANFTFPVEVFRLFLSFPLILFLPAIFIYSFYPRYVFRKIFDYDVFKQIERLEGEIKKEPQKTLKDKLDMAKMLADIKDKMILERKAIPIVSLKDSFSIVLAFVMAIQTILLRDSLIREFVEMFVNFGSK